MRARLSTLSFLATLVSVSVACSSSSDGGSPATDGGIDTSGGDTIVTTDTNGGEASDTKPASDAKSDAKPVEDTTGDTAIEGFACDALAQVGCTAPKTKCTAIDDGSGGVVAGCVAPSGTAAVDATCTRKSEDAAGIGDDSCAPGAYCSSLGTYTTPPTRTCRKFCSTDADCGTTKKCSALVPDPGGGPGYGLCVPTCTLFGTDCASGMDCSVVIVDTDGIALYSTCRGVGTVAAGGTCTGAPDCAAGLLCNDPTTSGTSTCNALCDSTHACPTGKTCKASGLPSGGGLCQ